jgi:hypothetical protein
VNGDGYDDILVSSPYNDGAGSNSGEVYLYFGSKTGPSSVPDWSDLGEAAYDNFGTSLAGVGDVNSDGYDDIIIGAPLNDGAASNAGETYVYFGSATGPSTTPDWSDQGEAAGDYFGFSVDGAGDVNGDGYDDIIIGAHYNDGTLSNQGEAYVYYGSPTGPGATPNWTEPGEAASDYFGYSVAGVGDVNNDGYDDVLIGAPYNDGAASNAGEIYIYRGTASGLNTAPIWSEQGEAANNNFGISLASAGDVNADSFADIIVGTPYYIDGGSSTGKAYVYHGSVNFPGTTPDWTDTGEASSDYYAQSVSGMGDLDKDGYDDIAIGAYANDDGGSNSGKVYLHTGSSNGAGTNPYWVSQGKASSDYFGFDVSAAGDVDSDGYADILIGAYGVDLAGTDTGKAYLYSLVQYAECGRYISDTFSVENFNDFAWLSIEWFPFSQPDETEVKFQIATNEDGVTWNFLGPDGTESTFFTNPHGHLVNRNQLGSFVKVRIHLSTTKGSITPTIEEFTVNYKMVEEPLVILTSPNGGEDWMKGDYYPITWNAIGELNSSSITLLYSTDNGATWSKIIENTANTGYYNWTVPNVDTPSALIKVIVTDIYGNSVSDTSDASFAIDPPPINPSGAFSGNYVGGGPLIDNSNDQVQVEIGDSDKSKKESDGNRGNNGNIDYSLISGIITLTIILIISVVVNLYFVTRNKRVNDTGKKLSNQKFSLNHKSKPVVRQKIYTNSKIIRYRK